MQERYEKVQGEMGPVVLVPLKMQSNSACLTSNNEGRMLENIKERGKDAWKC